MDSVYGAIARPRNRLPSLIALAALAALPATAHETHGPHVVSSADRTVEVPMQSPMNYFSERCVQLAPGTRMSFDVETEHPVDFNVHHHTATDTEFPVRMRLENRYAGTLSMPGGGEYCFMWQNPQMQPGNYSIRLHYTVASD